METLNQARALLQSVTPLAHDCGALCDSACCREDEDGQGGVHLFPGEAGLIGPVSWAEWSLGDTLDGAPVLRCQGRCERAKRPFGCMIFPLTPVPMMSGSWDVRMDRRAFAMCPLAPSGAKGLDPAFTDAVRRAINLLAQDPETHAFLSAWAKLERSYRTKL